MPPSFLPANVRAKGRLGVREGDVPSPLTPVGVPGVRESGDANPPSGCRLGMPFSGVVSVILRGMPRDLRGTVGAGFFFKLF